MHMNKRILSLTLALVMILGTFTAVFAAETTAQEKAGRFLEEVGLLKGDEDGDLLLGEELERRDSVVLLSRLLGEEDLAVKFETDEKTPSWTDVRSDDYYVPFFAWAETKGYFEGKDNGKFEPRASLTTQEYAVVLLRALGHDLSGAEAWKTVMDKANKEGLMENVESKANEALLRGDMAVMTLNALKATVKGTGKTLAEELDIKLPVPAKLEVVDVYADNLKEVKVVTNGAEITEDALKAENYSLRRGANIEDVRVEGNELVLVLGKDKKLDNKKDDVLTIKGTKNIDGKYDLKVYDNEAPYVVSVEALGNKAIKVTMSEPVESARQNNFKLDGKNYFGKVTVTGREITLVPYGSRLEVGEHELIIGVLEDFAGFKSVETLELFEVIEDKEAPEVVKAEGTLDYVDITFSEDVDEDSINNNTLYWNKKSNRTTYKKLAGNKYRFTFRDDLPMYEVTLNISGVKDYSGNEMKTTEIPYKGDIDTDRPEIIDVSSEEANKVVLVFNKDLNKNSVEDKSNYTVFDHNDKKVAVKSASFKNDKDLRVVEVELYSNLEVGKENTIKVSGVRDNTRFKNVMIDAHETFVVKAKQGDAEVKSVVGKLSSDGKQQKIYVTFSKEMDIETLVNADNYTISDKKEEKDNDEAKEVATNERLLSSFDDVSFDVYNNGKSVEITIESKEDISKIGYIKFLGVRDINGNLIKENTKNKLINENKIVIKEAKAVDRKTIEIKTSTPVFDMDKSIFNIGNVEVDRVEVDGTTKVVLKLKDNLAFDLTDNTFELNGSVTAEGTLGKTDVELHNDVKLEDEIRPEVKKNDKGELVTVAENGKVTIEFTESLLEMDGNLLAQDIEVIDLKTNEPVKVSKDTYEIESIEKVGGSNKITINFKKTGDYTIAISKDAKYIMDENNNVAREMKPQEVNIINVESETE